MKFLIIKQFHPYNDRSMIILISDIYTTISSLKELFYIFLDDNILRIDYLRELYNSFPYRNIIIIIK